jgi:2-polyprenyl-3-methyl-5-hydroxy-6-metoxy-1,4-benzoquinol methylase
MEKPICPVCNNKKIICIYKRIYGLKKLLKCEVCGLYFIWPKPILSENKQLYTKEYYNRWALKDLRHEGLVKVKHATFRRILDIVEKYKNVDSLLDIGCSFGYFLELAEDRGWDSYGIEISEYAAKEAIKKIGVGKVTTGNFMDLSLAENRFDVITMIDVIEHIYDISGALKKCEKLLRQKGLLIMVTPNTDSFSHKCLRRYWPHFNEEHVTYFSSKYVEKILDLNGFKLLKVSNFKRAVNLYYIKSQIYAHCRKFLIFLIGIINILTPPPIKKIVFFMLHGEMLVIAQKK